MLEGDALSWAKRAAHDFGLDVRPDALMKRRLARP
jgi:hypothetical protein